jgi:hypothetical protein
MSALFVVGAAALALVTQDAAPLRAAPTANAAQHAQLAAGDLIELRGQRFDHWQVYDHRRERAGFVRQSAVRVVDLDAAHAPSLLSVAQFLADTPGAEALGIAYVAAYLKAAPSTAINAEPFDLLGAMAERLARRASAKPAITGVAAQMQTVAQYGVTFTTFERHGALQLCYDGDAFRRVLAMPATSAQRARATLALTRHDCIDPGTPTRDRLAHDLWRAERLDAIDATAMASLPGPLKNRLRLRRAGVGAAIAFAHSRTGEPTQGPAQRAIDEFAAVDRHQLGDTEAAEYEDAALRVGASRWAALPSAPTSTRLPLATQPGAEAGQTCIAVGDPAKPLVARCTYGTVWTASWRVASDGNAAVLAVQLLPTWTELWVLRATRSGWTVNVLTPAVAGEPGIGYAEFAGFVPQQKKLLVAREAKADGKLQRRFEVLALDTLAAERSASTSQLLAAFGRWQDAAWVRGTVSLR